MASRRRLKKRHVLVPVAVLVVAASIAGIMWLAAAQAPNLEAWIEGFGAWGPAVYLGVCTLGAVVLLPGSATKLAAGALFGLVEGLFWGFAGAVLGSFAAFWVARLGRQTWVEQRLVALPRMAHFDRSVAEHGRRIALLMRLSPLVPFSLLNYAFGLSQVRFRDYALASFGMAPSILLYVYSGEVARQVVEAAGGATDKPWWEWLLLVVGLIATIAASHTLTKKAKEAMGREVVEEEEALEAELLEGEPSTER